MLSSQLSRRFACRSGARRGIPAAGGRGRGRRLFDFYISGIRAGEFGARHRDRCSALPSGEPHRCRGCARPDRQLLLRREGHRCFERRRHGRAAELRRELEFASRRASHRDRLGERDAERVSVEPPRKDPAGSCATGRNRRPGLPPPSRSCATRPRRHLRRHRRCLRRIAPVAADARRAVARDDTMFLRGTYLRIEGEAHSLSSAARVSLRLVFTAGPEGIARLERVETPNELRRGVLERR